MKNTSVKNKRHTYCNPLAIPDLPRGKDDWYPFERGMFSHENKPESVTEAELLDIIADNQRPHGVLL